MKVKYSKHAWFHSMPDEGIAVEEVEATIRRSERTVKFPRGKFKFLYRDLEVVAQRENGCWFVITCYRIK